MASKRKYLLAVLAVAVPLIGGFEGLRNYAYRDPVGIPTICFGETKGVQMGDYISTAECTAMLEERVRDDFYTGVDQCLNSLVPVKTMAAFVSFAYNVGISAFCGSTLVRLANAGDLIGACNQLPRWVRAGGFVLPGLVSRRNVEKALCLEGVAEGIA